MRQACCSPAAFAIFAAPPPPLTGRQVLTKLNLASAYAGQEKPDGAEYHVEPQAEGPRPFRAFLDVGLVRTTTGARVFGVLKGAVDGGLDIPHR